MAADTPPPRRALQAVLVGLLGAWFTLSGSMAFVASGNFRVVEPADLRHSAEVFAAIPEGVERRAALRYVASEINRDFFWKYDKLSLAMAVAAVLLLLASRGARPWQLVALVLCLGTALADTLWASPTLTELGRRIDFVPRDPPLPADVVRFYDLHKVNVTLALAKLLLIAAVGSSLVRTLARERPAPA